MIDSLQAGRALAALAVVIHHSALAANDFAAPLPGQRWLELGYLGVDFFFVLSGFIIYHSTVGRSKSAADYANARLRRIYIPYLPVGIALALLYSFFPSISAGHRHWDWLPTLTLFPAQEPALSVAWTLQHEVLFYLVFGLFYFSGRLLLGLGIWGALILLNALFFQLKAIPLALINLEFLMGIGVAILKDRPAPPFWIAAIPAIAWLALGADRQWSILFGLSCALAMWRFVRLELDGKLRVAPWLAFLGAASYSLYLTHGLAISVVGRILAGHSYSIFATGLVAGTLAGIAYFLAIERPLLALTKRRPASVGHSALHSQINQA